jgi:hypothetical protein
MSNLIWKEWHEQSWKLGFGCVVLGALALIGLHARIVDDETMSMWVCFLGITLLPVLSSTGLLSAERSEGSFESLLALPVAPWRILLAKTEMGFILCAGPMVAAAAVSILIAGGREITTEAMLSLYSRSILATLSLFIWMLALTARLPSEARAGLLSLGILICWMLATGGLIQIADPTTVLLASSISPFALIFGYSSGFEHAPPLIFVVIVQAAIVSILWKWASGRLTGPVEEKS